MPYYPAAPRRVLLQQDQESCAKYLGEMRMILHGDRDHPADPNLVTELVVEVSKVGAARRCMLDPRGA